MGTRTAKFVTSRLMSEPDFSEWVRSVLGDGSERESIGVLGFEGHEPCQRLVAAMNFRKSPTVIVMVDNFEFEKPAPLPQALPGFKRTELVANADISACVLSRTDVPKHSHSGLHSASTVADLFGIMRLHEGEPWSFDVEDGGIEQQAPLREFALHSTR